MNPSGIPCSEVVFSMSNASIVRRGLEANWGKNDEAEATGKPSGIKDFFSALASAELEWMKIKYVYLSKKQSCMKVGLLMFLICYETKECKPKTSFKKGAWD